MKCSIITATLNRADFVERAICSVEEQSIQDLEHLIIDGGSTDGSFEIYKRYPHLVVSVGEDHNVYDAFNKGIAMATGDIIGILNSDDVYRSDVLRTIVNVFASDPEIDIVSGGCVFVKGKGRHAVTVARYVDSSFLRLDAAMLLRQPPLINGRFFRKHVFDRVGDFDCAFPVVADREFMIRCALARLNNQIVNEIFCEYTLHDDALSHKPEGVGIRVLQENLDCALTSKRKAVMPETRRIHGYWAAWSALQLTIAPLRQGGLFKAVWMSLKYSSLFCRNLFPLLRMIYQQRWQQRLYRPNRQASGVASHF